MLSNKTYFLEEVTKHKREKKTLKRELAVLQEKSRLTDETAGKKDARIDELLAANQILTDSLQLGTKEVDKLFE